MNMYGLLLAKKLSGGGGGGSTLVSKTITANGTYNPSDDNADGYSVVVANVPNTYTLSDEGKVVDSGALVAQTAKNIDANGLYDTTLNNSVSVDVPNTYTAGDEGKVVSSGTLVSQSSRNIDANGTYDTTLNNSVDVSVPNSYTVADEGKVVSSGALVSQTAYPSTIVTNGTYDTTLNNSVVVDVPPTPAETKSVVFYDYDGTELYSYTPTEFAALTELPANPTHSGLTAQGWNWSLADAKAYVADYKYLNIGQMYITDDGKTRLYIHLENGLLTPALCLYAGSSGGGVVDWGDGSPTESVSASMGGVSRYQHTYAVAGDYIITLTVTRGSFQLVYDNTRYAIISGMQSSDISSNMGYKNSLQKCEIGTSITSIGRYAFNGCYSLKSITIPNTVLGIGDYCFTTCYSLVSVTIPSGISDIKQCAFSMCYSLKSICIPNTVTSIGQYAFQNCRKLRCLTLPTLTSFTTNSLTYNHSLSVFTAIINQTTLNFSNIDTYCLELIIVGGEQIGSIHVSSAYNLQQLILKKAIQVSISNAYKFMFDDINAYQILSLTNADSIDTLTIPSGVYRCEFRTCLNLKHVNLHDGMTYISFVECYSLDSINIPNGVTSIMFQNCRSLRTVNIPTSVTSLSDNTFSNCYSLSEIEIPSSVTSIGSNAFANCYSLGKITINAAEGAISGAPWGATNATVVWTG